MEHIAIMRKSWGLTSKILSGQKKIESRWYAIKYKPWNTIRKGDTVYFKDSGESVRIKAKVSRVMQFSDLTPKKVRMILGEYAKDDGLEPERIHYFFEKFHDKKYCILVFLKNPTKVQPFDIDKTGYGAMSAWIIVDDVSRIKISRALGEEKIRR